MQRGPPRTVCHSGDSRFEPSLRRAVPPATRRSPKRPCTMLASQTQASAVGEVWPRRIPRLIVDRLKPNRLVTSGPFSLDCIKAWIEIRSACVTCEQWVPIWATPYRLRRVALQT